MDEVGDYHNGDSGDSADGDGEMKTVYVAGPYSKGDKWVNVWRAMECGEILVREGFVPYIPHLTHFWDLEFTHDYEFWMGYDLVWLKKCDCVLRIKGESEGADREVEIAKENGIPVYYSLKELMKG